MYNRAKAERGMYSSLDLSGACAEEFERSGAWFAEDSNHYSLAWCRVSSSIEEAGSGKVSLVVHMSVCMSPFGAARGVDAS